MTKKELVKFIEADKKRYNASSKDLNRIQGFKFMKALRKTRYYKEQKNIIMFSFYKTMLDHYEKKYGFQISYATNIGRGFYIGHFGTIIINWKTKIGNNCNISPGVTIGQTNRGTKKGTPVIGNEVWIGTNAVIVGNITIGDDVLIAPNSYVNFDVPSHSIVLGNPAVIHSRDKATLNYIDNKVE